MIEENKELEKKLAAEMGIGDLTRYQSLAFEQQKFSNLPRDQGGPGLSRILQKNIHLNCFLRPVLVFVSRSQLLLRYSGFPSSLSPSP